MLVTSVQEKGGDQEFMFYFASSCAEVGATRIWSCVLWEPTSSSLRVTCPPASASGRWFFPGSGWLLAGAAGQCRCRSSPGFLLPQAVLRDWATSCASGWPPWTCQAFLQGSSHASAPLSPSLALAPWVRVLNRIFALKRLSSCSAFCWTHTSTVDSLLIFLIEVNRVERGATKKLRNRQKHFRIINPHLLWIRLSYLFSLMKSWK